MNKQALIQNMIKPNLEKMAQLCAENGIPFVAAYTDDEIGMETHWACCTGYSEFESAVVLLTNEYPKQEEVPNEEEVKGSV